MATKFSDFTAQAATGTTFVVGYDGTTNTRYTRTQTTDFVFGGTLGQSNTLTLGGYQINLSQGGSGNFLYMNGTSTNAYFLQGRYNGQAKASLGLNTGSGRLELWHAGTTKYIDLNPKDYVNYLLANTSIGANSGTPPAKLHVKGQGTTDATTAFLVENNNGDDILNLKDNRQVQIGTLTSDTETLIVNGSTRLKNQVTVDTSTSATAFRIQQGGAYTVTMGRTAGSTGFLNVNSNNFTRFTVVAGSGVAINPTGTASNAASAALTVTSTTKGMLPPRMNNTQRDAISSPATGLTLYSTTDNKLQFYNGSAWQDAAGGATLYTADGSINEDRVITVGHDATTRVTYNTSFESSKSNNTTTRNSAGNIVQIKETYTSQVPVSYSQTRGAVLKLRANTSSGTANAEGYINAFIINSGSSDYTSRDQMGFRTNKAFVFKATDTSWPIYFAVKGGPSNNPRSMIFSPGNGGLLQLSAGNARTTKLTLADTSSTGTSNGYYRYIEGGNHGTIGKLILGRRLNGQSEEAYITCSGVGGASGDIAVGVNQGTPTATLHVTGSGATNATTSLLVENSSGTDALSIKDNGAVTIEASELILSNLPTSDPGVEGQLWNDEGTLKVSTP